MKYPDSYERDYKFYVSMLDTFDFDGSADYLSEKVECFRIETNGRVLVNTIPAKLFNELFPTISSNYNGKHYGFELITEEVVQFDKEGVDAKRAFFEWDSNGKVYPTNEPDLLRKLLKTKGSTNFHIKLYAEDLAKGFLPRPELRECLKEWNAPDWVYDACIKQSYNYPPFE